MSLSLASIAFTTAVKATVQNTIDGTVANSAVALGVTRSPSTALTSGTGAYQANRFWQSTGRVLGSSASETINLYSFSGIDVGAGSGNGPLGGAMALTNIVGLLICVSPSSADTITVGGQGTSNAWTGIFSSNAVTIGPFRAGGHFEFFDPSASAPAVGSASNNLLKILAGAGGATYDIYVLGRQ